MAELLGLEALRELKDDLMEVEDPCIYFMWDGDELLYIGGTNQSCERIARHIRERNHRRLVIPFKRTTFLEVTRQELWELEHKYIHHYQPPYNELMPRLRAFY